MTPDEALAFIRHHGVVCEAARHEPIPCLVDAIAGEPVRGSWWSHPHRREIFAISRAVRAAPEVLVCRLVAGKITFVHRRMWPALVRRADRLVTERLARVRELHGGDGKHVIEEIPFPQWVPVPVTAAAKQMSAEAAAAELARVPASGKFPR